MSQPESKHSFFRQGTWMVGATVVAGALMTLVHTVVSSRMPVEEYTSFVVLLRCLILLNIPASGLQIVFAQQSAAALTEERQRQLSSTARQVALTIFLIWLAMLVLALFVQGQIVSTLRITSPMAFWLTMCVALTSLWQPMLKGILQGNQNFMGVGGIMMLDGVGRFVSVCFIVLGLSGQCAGAMAGALFGQVLSIAAGIFWCWNIFKTPAAPIDWRPWLKQVVPLTLGSGAVVVLANTDMVYIQSIFPDEVSKFYIAGAMIGFALTQFTLPLAVVMFPKLVQSAARAQKSDALRLTLISTAVVGGLAVLLSCTHPFIRELPLRILYLRSPKYWAAAPMVPWFLACMLLSAMANVLVNALLARAKFAIVPWLVLVTVGFLAALALLNGHLQKMEMFAAFKLVVETLSAFNGALLLLSAWFVWGKREVEPVAPTPTAAG